MENQVKESVVSEQPEKQKGHYKELYKDLRSVKERRQNAENSRLSFLYHFSKRMGISWSRLAQDAGFVQQNLIWWIKVDDCKLSQVEKILAPHGYRVIPSFERLSEEELNSVLSNKTLKTELCEIKGLDCIPQNIQARGKTRTHRNTLPFLQEYSEGSHLLSFFAKALLEDGMGLYEFCKKHRINASLLLTWLKADDIRISKLYRYAEYLDRKLVWTFEKL